jgi:glycerol-3-phosphate cytidylyltransferase
MPRTTGAPVPLVIGGTVGAFDLFHIGHLRFLQAARAQCDFLKVGVGSDRLVHQGKDRPTVFPADQRLETLAGLRCVDEACVFDVGLDQTDAAVAWFKAWSVNIVFVSEDWSASARWRRLAPALTARDIRCHWLPYTPSISTTQIRQTLHTV